MAPLHPSILRGSAAYAKVDDSMARFALEVSGMGWDGMAERWGLSKDLSRSELGPEQRRE